MLLSISSFGNVDEDIESIFVAESLEQHVYYWFKKIDDEGNSTLARVESWRKYRGPFMKDRDDLRQLAKIIHEGKREEACSWVDNVLSDSAKEQIPDDVYEYLGR